MKTFNSILLASLLSIVSPAHAVTFDYSGNTNLDVQWGDPALVGQNANVVMLDDTQIQGTLRTDNGFIGKVTLACDQQKIESADQCYKDFKLLAKDIQFGYAKTIDGQEFLIMAGKGTVAFGDSVTQRAFDMNDPVNQLDRQMWRKPVIMVKLSPSFSSDSKMSEILGVIKSIEVTGYNNKAGLTNDLSKAINPDSYAVRLSYALMKVSGQVSYLHQEDGERRWDASVKLPEIKGFKVYGDYQSIKNSTIDPNTKSAALVGVSHGFMGGDAALEGSAIKHNTPVSTGSGEDTTLNEKRVTAAYSHVLKQGEGYSITGRAELSEQVNGSHLSSPAGGLRVNASFDGTTKTQDLFAGTDFEKSIKARNAKLDAINAAKAAGSN